MCYTGSRYPKHKGDDTITEMPSLVLLIAIGALGAAVAVTMAIVKPLIEEGMENAGVEPTFDI